MAIRSLNLDYEQIESRGWLYSLLFHAIIIVLLIVSFPSFQRKNQNTDRTVIVDLVKVSELTNLKNQSSAIQPKKEKDKTLDDEANNSDNKLDVPKNVLATEDKITKPDNENKEVKENQVPKIEKNINEKNISEDKKEDAVSLKKKEDKKEDKKDEKKDKPKEIKKEEKKDIKKDVKKDSKKEDKNTKQKPKPKKDAWEEMMKDMEKKSATKKSPSVEPTDDANHTTKAYDNSMPLSVSEIDMIISQIEKAWNVTTFETGDSKQKMYVKLKISLDPNGVVQNVVPILESGFKNNPLYKTFVDSAVRAVYVASPIKGLSPEKYATWKEMQIMFDPKNIMY